MRGGACRLIIPPFLPCCQALKTHLLVFNFFLLLLTNQLTDRLTGWLPGTGLVGRIGIDDSFAWYELAPFLP